MLHNIFFKYIFGLRNCLNLIASFIFELSLNRFLFYFYKFKKKFDNSDTSA